MIYYNTQDFWSILFTWRGSPLAGHGPHRALAVALLSLAIVAFDMSFKTLTSIQENNTAMDKTLSALNSFMALLISFRLNAAFGQWRSGVVSVSSFAAAVRTLMSMACSYLIYPNVNQPDAMSSGITPPSSPMMVHSVAREKAIFQFLTDLRRLLLLYVGLVFAHFRNTYAFNGSTMMTQDECNEMNMSGAMMNQANDETSVKGPPNKRRVVMVELWIRRLLIRASHSPVTAPLLTPAQSQSLNNLVTGMTSLYHALFTIATCPIPFNYAQFVEICILSYLMLYAAVLVPSSGLATSVWVFAWGLVLFTADDVANEIECPFGTDANDIDLEKRLLQIEEEVTVLFKSTLHTGHLSHHATDVVSPGFGLKSMLEESDALLSETSHKGSYETLETYRASFSK